MAKHSLFFYSLFQFLESCAQLSQHHYIQRNTRQIKPWNNPLESSEALEASKIQGQGSAIIFILVYICLRFWNNSMFSSCPCTCPWSRVGLGYSYKVEPEGVLRLGISYLMTLPWRWMATLGKLDSHLWYVGFRSTFKQPGALPVLVKDALQTWLILCILSQSGGWAVFLSWSPASHTCCLWDFSILSHVSHFFVFEAGKDQVYNR